MGDKSPKSKSRIKVQKAAAKAKKQSKKDRRQASWVSEPNEDAEQVKKVS